MSVATIKHLDKHKVNKDCYMKKLPFKCKTCGRCFLRKDNLKRHAYSKYCVASTSYIKDIEDLSDDDEIDNETNQAETIVQDISDNQSDKETYKCDKCDVVFNLLQNLRSHKCLANSTKNHHSSKYDCDICNKSFTPDELLELHKKAHSPFHKQKTFKKTKTKLKTIDPRPFKCTNCGIGFSRESKLKGHKLKKLCDPELDPLQFKRNFQAIKHKANTKNILQICNVCGDDLRNVSSLKRHKKYKCSVRRNIFAMYVARHLIQGLI